MFQTVKYQRARCSPDSVHKRHLDRFSRFTGFTVVTNIQRQTTLRRDVSSNSPRCQQYMQCWQCGLKWIVDPGNSKPSENKHPTMESPRPRWALRSAPRHRSRDTTTYDVTEQLLGLSWDMKKWPHGQYMNGVSTATNSRDWCRRHLRHTPVDSTLNLVPCGH